MIHRWMEQWFDTFLFLVMLVGMLIFFICFWRGEFQIRYAEAIALDFLTEVSVKGKITQENIEVLWRNLGNVSMDYSVILEGTKYINEPIYTQIPQEYLSKYFTERNRKKQVTFQEYKLQIYEESIEKLKLQKETNLTLLAAENTGYLPLPGDKIEWNAEAVCPVQEVYEKESLITLCRVSSEKGNYYAEAEPFFAEQSGVVHLNLQLGEKNYQVPIVVICHPRTIQCCYGHEVVNTEMLLKEYKLTGKVSCLYCRELPKQIIVDNPIIYKKSGSRLNGFEVSLLVEYMDGHTAIITPDSQEWQDSYDENYCGIQQVEVRYRGEEVSLTVISENERCVQCGDDCNERCYTDYLRFPYCLSCLEKQNVFTCEFYEAELKLSQDELFDELEQKKEICFSAGDFVRVKLLNRNQSVSLLQKPVRRAGERNEN